MPHKLQLVAVLAFGVAMLFIENQIQILEESRAKLGKTKTKVVHFVSIDYCTIIILMQSAP